jgi:hypothetical protein
MVEKAQQTGPAVGQRQDCIVESRLRIVPSWFHEKDLNNSHCSGKSTSLLYFPSTFLPNEFMESVLTVDINK